MAHANRSESPPHAPQTGLARRLLGRFHVTGVFWFKFHRFGISILPEWGIWLFVTLFTTFFFFALINIRRGIARNLEAVLGPCGFFRRQARIYKTMWEFAWCLSERYERLATEKRVAVQVDGREIWDRMLDDPRGFVLVTAHIGHWEVGSMLASDRQQQRTVHVVREEETDPRAQEFIEGLIRQQGSSHYQVHFARDDDLSLGTLLIRALRDGEIVALQSDRPRHRGRTVHTTLFGRPFGLPEGPAALARAAEVALLPIYVLREGRLRARIIVREPIEVPSSGDRAADVATAAQTLAAHIEWAIRQRPNQWFCFRPLWEKM